MNGAHIHLLVNHLPVMGIMFSIPLLTFAWRRGDELLRRVALFAAMAAGLLALPAYLTGGPAEEVVEHLSGVNERAIESHEEVAKFALGVSIAEAVVAAGGLALARRKGKVPSAVLATAFGVVCISAGLMAITAYRGGEIRHPEITAGEASAGGEPRQAEDEL